MSPSSLTQPLSPPSILSGCPQILRKELPPSVWHWESSHQACKRSISLAHPCPALQHLLGTGSSLARQHRTEEPQPTVQPRRC